MPEPDSENRELLCELTQAELLNRGDAMADAELHIERLKAQRSEVADRIKAERATRRKLAGIIDAGKEFRQVRCAWIERFENNCFELVRQDTGAVVDTRAMTAADRQETIDLGGDDEELGPEGDDEELEEPGPARARGARVSA